MLAGWLRIKYPSVVDGAIAASAPIWQVQPTLTLTLTLTLTHMTGAAQACPSSRSSPVQG